MTRVLYNENIESLVEEACALFFSKVEDLPHERVVVGFPGGRSIVPFLTQLTESTNQLSASSWRRLEFLMVDERFVGLEHEDSNFRLVSYFLLELVSREVIGESQIHPFVYRESEDDGGIAAYEKTLIQLGGKYHCIFLGVGEDAHVAALFPNHHSISSSEPYFVSMDDSPKPPLQRMTVSASLLKRTDFAVALLLGETKKDALREYRDPGLIVQDCPLKLIDSVSEAYILTDQRV